MAVMRAMVLDAPRTPLVMRERPVPAPGAGEILVAVAACGVCRTDLHVVDGELEHPKLPIVPGHEIVGRVAALGAGVSGFSIGERVGVPWLGATCGVCPYCRSGAENLCDTPVFTGYTRDGGYATHAVADARYCFPLGEAGDDADIAPWLCAGLIGWRSYRMAGEGNDARALRLRRRRAHPGAGRELAGPARLRLHAQGRHGGAGICALARRGVGGRLGRYAAGTARRGDHLRAGRRPGAGRAQSGEKGGRVVCGGIHMSDIPSFPYALLWEERHVMSVANLTRADARRISVDRAAGGRQMRGHALSAGARQRGAVRFARRAAARRGGAYSLKSAHRLGVADHALDRRRALLEGALQRVDLFVHLLHARATDRRGSGN